MADRLPPLSALRAFEAAARSLSFTKAGLELNVTQAAVSYQVRRLEDHFGTKLFHRLNRALALTDAGHGFFAVVGQAFDLLAVDSHGLAGRDRQQAITVSASQSLAAKWLIPRLDRFRERYPQVRIHIDATDAVADLAQGKVHLALRYARRIDPALNSVLLFTEQVFPVCSPVVFDGGPPLGDPRDLCHHTLIHDVMTDVTWRDWLGATGIEGEFATHGPSFSHSGLAIDAAIEGQGIALGRSALIVDDLSAGRLIRPFDITLLSSYAYYVVCFGDRTDNPNVAAFVDWVLLEAKQSETAILKHSP
jgi:LysR family transcriptional regulator, glycine cleavage system transcriptional activator